MFAEWRRFGVALEKWLRNVAGAHGTHPRKFRLKATGERGGCW